MFASRLSLFVDTSIWFAAVDCDDPCNSRAMAILESGEPLVTTDHILVETWWLINRRIRRDVAEKFWEELRHGAVAVETVGPADLETAWQIGLDWRDQDFSIVDRTSFAVMRRLAPRPWMTILRYFAMARRGVTPSASFDRTIAYQFAGNAADSPTAFRPSSGPANADNENCSGMF
jgi:predicted nucleic acid-binding protein